MIIFNQIKNLFYKKDNGYFKKDIIFVKLVKEYAIVIYFRQ